MSMDRSSVISRVRDLIGDPSTDEYADAKIDRAITDTLLEYSKFVPRLARISLTTTPGESYYVVADDVLTILACSYADGGSSFDVENPFTYPVFGSGMSGSYTVNPSMQGIAMDRFLNNFQQDLIERDDPYQVNIVGSQLEFLPTPSVVQSVYLQVGKAHTDSTFPKVHEFIFARLVAAVCATELANKRSKFPSMKIGSESVQFRDPQYLLTQAASWRKEAEDYLGRERFLSGGS